MAAELSSRLAEGSDAPLETSNAALSLHKTVFGTSASLQAPLNATEFSGAASSVIVKIGCFSRRAFITARYKPMPAKPAQRELPRGKRREKMQREQ